MPRNDHTTARYQFTLARMISWVFVAAGVCFIIRNAALVTIAGVAVLPAILLWATVAAMGLTGALWNRFWDTRPGRLLLKTMLIVIAVPFSPLLLLCLDWEQLAANWRRIRSTSDPQ